jgi:hypothetical protein
MRSSFLDVSLKQFDINKQNVLNITLYFITCLILLHMVHAGPALQVGRSWYRFPVSPDFVRGI